MDKIPKPKRDWYRTKSKIVSAFLGFATTKTYIYLCMFFSLGIFFLFGINGYTKLIDYSGWWIGLTLLFIALPQVVFRVILRYRTIPKNWSLGQFKKFSGITNSPFVRNSRGIPNISNDDGLKIIKIIGYLIAWIIGLYLYSQAMFWIVAIFVHDETLVDIFGIGVVASMIVLPTIYTKLRHPELYHNNRTSMLKAHSEAKYGRHFQKWVIGFCVWGMVGVFFMLYFEIENFVFTVPAYFGGLIICGLGFKNKFGRR